MDLFTVKSTTKDGLMVMGMYAVLQRRDGAKSLHEWNWSEENKGRKGVAS